MAQSRLERRPAARGLLLQFIGCRPVKARVAARRLKRRERRRPAGRDDGGRRVQASGADGASVSGRGQMYTEAATEALSRRVWSDSAVQTR